MHCLRNVVQSEQERFAKANCFSPLHQILYVRTGASIESDLKISKNIGTTMSKTKTKQNKTKQKNKTKKPTTRQQKGVFYYR